MPPRARQNTLSSRGSRGSRAAAASAAAPAPPAAPAPASAATITISIEGQEPAALADADLRNEEDEAELSTSSDPASDTQDRPPLTPIVIGDVTYYDKVEYEGKKGKKKTAYIWNYGFEIIHATSKTKHYYCRLCLDEKEGDKSYKPLTMNGTSSILTHFRSKHNRDKQGNIINPTSAPPSGTASPMPDSQIISLSILDKFKLLLIQWIVFCHIAFSQVENAYLLALISFLSEAFAKLMPSRVTVRGWISTEFHKRKTTLSKELRRARSKIHLSFDLWTSPNCYGMIAIVGHYIDRKGCRQTTLLAIRKIVGEHSGENIAACVCKVVREYRIRKKVGFFVLDNASVNGVAVDRIMSSLHPDMPEKQRKRRRLRCFNHITNLIAKAFLLGVKSEETVDQLLLAEHHGDFGEIADVWRKHGTLGRLQNIIRHIRLTPQRRHAFKQCKGSPEDWKEFGHLEVCIFCAYSPFPSLDIPIKQTLT
jgi:hypothetical protein